MVSKRSLCIKIKGESEEEGGQSVLCTVLLVPMKIHGDSPAPLFPLHFTKPSMEGGPSTNPRSYTKSVPFTNIPPFPELASQFPPFLASG